MFTVKIKTWDFFYFLYDLKIYFSNFIIIISSSSSKTVALIHVCKTLRLIYSAETCQIPWLSALYCKSHFYDYIPIQSTFSAPQKS